MSRIGGATAPGKCEENRRTPVEIKREPSDHEEHKEESNAKRRADSAEVKPLSSSVSTVNVDNNYEFLGHMKYEADESIALITDEPPWSKKRDICPLCQQVYNTKPRTYYTTHHRKREFIAHLVKVHDYSHLRGYCHRTRCRCCNAKRERWAFVVEEGNNFKFSDVCMRCQECRVRSPIADDFDGPPCSKSHRGSITSLWKSFVAHQEMNAEVRESAQDTAEAPSTSAGPSKSEGLLPPQH